MSNEERIRKSEEEFAEARTHLFAAWQYLHVAEISEPRKRSKRARIISAMKDQAKALYDLAVLHN